MHADIKGRPRRGRATRVGQFLLTAALLATAFAQAESPSQLGRVSAQVVAGRYFSCTLDTDGVVQCWGNNDHGQLGAAAPAQSAQPSTIRLAAPAVSIAVGRSHACALLSDGSVACWGANDQGQLGDGTTTDRTTPVAVIGLARRVVTLAAGERHTCALDTLGAVFCWGANDTAQLGGFAVPYAATAQRAVYVNRALALAAGDHHTCVVLRDGSAACWGSNGSGQLGNSDLQSVRTYVPQPVHGIGEAVVDVSAGGGHTCARGVGGSVYCWGLNSNGQVGDGSLADRATAVAVTGASVGLHRAVSLSAGFAHTCVVLDNDEMDCWGDNDDGQLGDGSTTEQLWPTPVAAGPFIAGANVSAGYSHTCAKTPTGGALCWGSNGYGELARTGADTNLPVAIGGHASGVVSVAASYAHFCALVGDGGVSCWGQNFSGELGNGSLRTGAHVPQPVVGLSGPALKVAAGQQHTCTALRDGTVQCWGRNAAGQLGDGTLATRPTPADVVGLAGPATTVAAGDEFACALLQNGQVMCWGANDSGQLGSGNMIDSAVPVRVVGLNASAIALAAGATHACALLADQTVACWGDNSETQLGSGSGPNRAQATPVVGLAGPVRASATAIAASEVATCVALDDGGVQCWGFDQDRGTLGQGTLTNSTSPPARVVGLGGRVAVFAGQYHFCAVGSAGDAACWGQGGNGQLGTGQKIDSGTPAAVVGLDGGAVAMAGSYSNTCAVRDSGALFCWGDGSNGMLGLGDGVPGILITPATVRLGQRIAFAAPGALTLGDPSPTLSAVASSAADVAFDTWTPDTCTISGNTVIALAPALCGIRATQAGNGVFAPAPPAYALVPVSGVPKFTLSKTSDAAALQVWQSFTYVIRVTNVGTDVGSANLTDVFPAIVDFDDSDLSRLVCKTTGDGTACYTGVQEPPFQFAGVSVTLPPAGTAELRIPARALATGDANNTVTLIPTSPVCQSKDCGGGSASTGPIPVRDSAYFTQTKTIDSAAHLTGDSVVYTISIANDGGDGSAQWQDDLPPQLTLLDVRCVAPNGAQCDASGSIGNALQGKVSLPHASSATITLTARADASGDITNIVRVTPTSDGCASHSGGSNLCGGGVASTGAARVYGARLSLQADFGGGARLSPSDQFLLTLGGSNGDSVVTTGFTANVTSRGASALGDAGAQFTLGEAMAAGSASALENYAPQLACTNALSPASGGTDPSTLQLNGTVTLHDGDRIGCVVHNAGARASVTLHQHVTPANDPGRFVLSAAGTSSGTLGDGGTLGPLTLDAGNYTLALAGANGTVLSQYEVSYRCVDAVTRDAVSSGSGGSAAIALGAGQHLDCTFDARFAHSRLAGALGGQRQYAQFGHVLTYLVEVANTGGVGATAAQVASPLSPAFDPARSSFVCVATPPATCLAQGSGALSDTPALPPGGRVSYVISAGLLATPPTESVQQTVAFGAASDLGATQNLTANTQLVIFRDSFQAGGDGSQWNTDAAAAPVSLSAQGAALDLSPALRRLQRGSPTDLVRGVAGGVGVRVEALRLENCVLLRLVTATGEGMEVPSAWLQLDAGNPIALLGRAEGSVILTGGNGETVDTALNGDGPLQLQVQ